MPTLARRPAALHERERLQARRLRAAELFALGLRQAEVARQLGVSAQAVSSWHAGWGSRVDLAAPARSGQASEPAAAPDLPATLTFRWTDGRSGSLSRLFSFLALR